MVTAAVPAAATAARRVTSAAPGWPALGTMESSTAWRAAETSAPRKATETTVWLALRECVWSTTTGIAAESARLRREMRRRRAIIAARDPAVIAAKHIGPGK
jgi:hypothetical protein